MIPELGQLALSLALAVALVQAAVPLYGAARLNRACMALARVRAIILERERHAGWAHDLREAAA